MSVTELPASPAFDGWRTTLPGWKAILDRQETFERLQRIHTSRSAGERLRRIARK